MYKTGYMPVTARLNIQINMKLSAAARATWPALSPFNNNSANNYIHTPHLVKIVQITRANRLVKGTKKKNFTECEI